MNQIVLAALVAAVGVWLIVPQAGSALSRLRPIPQMSHRAGRPEPLLGQASGLAGVGAGAVALLVLPGAAGILVAGWPVPPQPSCSDGYPVAPT